MIIEGLYRSLKPLANVYTIILSWILVIINLYLFMKPLNDYAAEAGLKTTPIVLDQMNYYTPDQGYQVLSSLGENGRHAYRLANLADFVLPALICLALALSCVALEGGVYSMASPLIYLFSDYIENIAEKYVLEIYPQRNDLIMTLACYFGIVKMISVVLSFFIVFFFTFQRMKRLKKKDL